MAPTCESVASVAQTVRANNPNHRNSTEPSAIVANVSTSSLLGDVGHGQDKLSEVPNPASPLPEPPVAAPSPPQPRTPGRARPHVFAGVAQVPVRSGEAAAIENIEKMRTFAWGLLRKWPLDGLSGWLDGGKETGSGQPALDTKPAPGAVHEDEETFADVPPPYSLR